MLLTEDRSDSLDCENGVRGLPQLPRVSGLPSDLDKISRFNGRVIKAPHKRSISVFEAVKAGSMANAIAVTPYWGRRPSEIRDDLKELAPVAGSAERWTLGSIGPLSIRGVLGYNSDLRSTFAVMGRADDTTLLGLLDNVRGSKSEGPRVSGYRLIGVQAPASVPGLGSLPLSETRAVRLVSYTNDTHRDRDEGQLAAVIGVMSSCGDHRPLEVYRWWYGDYVTSHTGRELNITYPSPVQVGDVHLHIALDPAAHSIRAFGTYGLPSQVFESVVAALPAMS
jgi:hypothetical protein